VAVSTRCGRISQACKKGFRNRRGNTGKGKLGDLNRKKKQFKFSNAGKAGTDEVVGGGKTKLSKNQKRNFAGLPVRGNQSVRVTREAISNKCSGKPQTLMGENQIDVTHRISGSYSKGDIT